MALAFVGGSKAVILDEPTAGPLLPQGDMELLLKPPLPRSARCVFTLRSSWAGRGKEGGEGGALKDWLYLRVVPARAPELLLKENRELNSELSPGLQAGRPGLQDTSSLHFNPTGLHGGGKWGQRVSSGGPLGPLQHRTFTCLDTHGPLQTDL